MYKKITSIVFYLQQTRSHTSINDNDLEKYIQHNCDERRRSSGFNAHNIVIRKKISVYPERDTNWYPEYLVKTEWIQATVLDLSKFERSNQWFIRIRFFWVIMFWYIYLYVCMLKIIKIWRPKKLNTLLRLNFRLLLLYSLKLVWI